MTNLHTLKILLPPSDYYLYTTLKEIHVKDILTKKHRQTHTHTHTLSPIKTEFSWYIILAMNSTLNIIDNFFTIKYSSHHTSTSKTIRNIINNPNNKTTSEEGTYIIHC